MIDPAEGGRKTEGERVLARGRKWWKAARAAVFEMGFGNSETLQILLLLSPTIKYILAVFNLFT